MSVAEARVGEIEQIKHVLTETWLETYASSYAAATIHEITSDWHAGSLLTRQMSNPRVYFGVAKLSDGTIVGVVTAKKLKDHVSLSLIRLYVLPQYQRRGISGTLLRAALDAYQGIRRVELVIEKRNVVGQSFWSNAGFRPIGSKHEQIGDVVMEMVTMERVLEQQ